MSEAEEKDIWLSASEIASLKLNSLPNSRGTVLRWADERNWDKRDRKGRGAGFIFSFSSFPAEAKQEIKSDAEKWKLVQEITRNRGKYQAKTTVSGQNNLPTNSSLSLEEKRAIIECSHRLVVEEYRLGLKGEELASKLGISLAELEKYELAELPLNILLLQKLKALGFDLMFIISGETAETSALTTE